MRLLNTRTGEFLWISNPNGFTYATLSHVWSTDGEQTYQDLLKIQEDVRIEREANPKLPIDAVLQRVSPKVRGSCAYALADGFDFLWIDSCCIDKTSSVELSEAINSMYLWYKLSTVCYGYLEDIDGEEDPRLPNSRFRWSRWYTRGWMLQELIAPQTVIFLSSDWRLLGMKTVLAKVIEEITGINVGVLTHAIPLNAVPVARRMSWAAKRVTTRKEDEAYSLMGLFYVNMPAIYGEGALAFIRLQEEILKQVPDQSIFVWDRSLDSYSVEAEVPGDTSRTLLASSPIAFAYSGGVRVIPWEDLLRRLHSVAPPPSYIPTSHGLRTEVPLLGIGPFFHLAILACADENDRLLALVLKKLPNTDVHSVGTTEWERIRRRYRPFLRALPWCASPRAAGDATLRDPLYAEAAFTRVVRLRTYPRPVPVWSVSIAHRPDFAALAHDVSVLQLFDQDTQDDLFPDATSSGHSTWSRVFMASFVDTLTCLPFALLAAVGVVIVAFIVVALAYLVRSINRP